jgi:hypothetical protein
VAQLKHTFKQFLDASHPTEVQAICQRGPFGMPRLAEEAAVLGRETQVRDMTQVLLEKSAISTRDDVDNVTLVRANRLQCIDESLGRDSSRRLLDDWRQSTLQ